MSKDHIRFSNLEFDSDLDQEHLEQCEQCQREAVIFRFLGFQVKSAPQIEPPPFFAQRMVQFAQRSRASLAFFVQRVAQQLVPAFAALVLATSFLLYQMAQQESITYQSEILFEEPVQEETISIDYVVNSLQEVSEEEPILEYPY